MLSRPTAMPQASAWRFFPWAVAAAIAVVIAVNSGLIWMAVRSFPGNAGSNGFAESNAYDRVLDAAAREARLGWTLRATLDRGRPVVALTRPDGTPVEGVPVSAVAERPVGPPERTELGFQPLGGGRYLADAALPGPGQWELMLSAGQGGEGMHATRRLVVR